MTDTETRHAGSTPEHKPGVSNLLTIYSPPSRAARSTTLEADYAGKGYGALKSDVADIVVAFTTPLRERTQEWLTDPAALSKVLAAGALRAREVADRTLAAVYDAVGFVPSGL